MLSQLRPLLPPPSSRPDILSGLHSPDDAAILTLPPSPPSDETVLIQSVDFFRSFLPDPYVFGMVAANHALSDVHAMNAQPSTAMAIVTVPYAHEDKVRQGKGRRQTSPLDSTLDSWSCLPS